MLTEYVGKVFKENNHVFIIGCEKSSGDYFQCHAPSSRFVFKPLIMNKQLEERGYRYLTQQEVAKFFQQKA